MRYPRVVRSRAPLRLGIGGGGTDVSPYCDEHGGVVLNASIALYTYTIIEKHNESIVEFNAADCKEKLAVPLGDPIPGRNNLLLHKGVYNRMVAEFNDGKPLPVRVTTFSDAGPGSGLGTSSALVVSMIKAFVEFLNLPLGEYEIAHLAYEIERKDLGLAGGKQDQYASAFGGFNFIEFYENDRVIVNPLRIKNWIVSELESSLILYDTGRSRSSAAIIQKQIDNVVQGEKVATHSLNQIKEDAYRMKEALLKGNIKQFGEYLDRSWRHKKLLSSSISNYRIDRLYSVAKSHGAFAGKVSGAGGGGYMMFLVDPLRRADAIEALSKEEGRFVPCRFTHKGTEGWSIL